MVTRIGFGLDVHQLKKGESLILGGIPVPHDKGTVAHSDGDVLIHAVCDSLLGAAALGDIGHHFPDTSEEYRGIDSRILLQKVTDLITGQGYSIGNIDCTLCLQSPKISSFIPSIRESLASVMNINPDQVSVKATTTEKLGYVGREEGVSCYATALIIKKELS
jgi:2-C-methyl-D-erythritol 2,4-cyclodiphosphate synthase